MKSNKNIFLAGLIVLATALASCEKEVVQPVIEQNDQPTSEGSKTSQSGNDEYKEFTVSFPASTDTTVYKGIQNTLTFGLDAPDFNKIKVSIPSTEGVEASVSYTPTEKSCTVTYTAETRNGRFEVKVEDDRTVRAFGYTFDTYYIELGDAPETFGDGEAFEGTVPFKTNLPEGEITVTAQSWITCSVEGTDLKFLIQENDTDSIREGSIILRDAGGHLEEIVLPITQDFVLRNRQGAVQFRDRAFKAAMLEIADSDGDGDVSPEEALAVETIDISGRGVKDLTGLDAFRNVWKFDARDNDIEDADVLKELPYLRWLDLRGNRNLRTFDLTGCSIYFDHCEFELTDDLVYKVVKRQIGAATYCRDTSPSRFASMGSDPKCEHAVFVDDPLETQDWSCQNTVHQLRTHSSGYGKTKIVFTGIGYTDRDVRDGTFGRIMERAAALFETEYAGTEFLDNVDILYMDRIIDRHDKWPMRNYDPSTYWMKSEYKDETARTVSEAYGAVTGVAPEDWMCANQTVAVILVDIVPNLQNSFAVMSARESYRYGSYDNRTAGWRGLSSPTTCITTRERRTNLTPIHGESRTVTPKDASSSL